MFLRICIPVLLCSASSLFAAEDMAKLAKTATETLRSGDADAAIEQFDAAFSAGQPTSAMIYNKAIAHFQKGETEIARQLFAQAGDDPKLAAKSRYNLGNTDYTDAVKLTKGEEPDPNGAISKLQSAISHYKRSLAMDRSDPDARANIESAHKLMRQLQQQQEQQQQNQQQQDNSQQDQDQQQQDQQQSESQNKDQKSQDQTSNQTPNDTEQSEEPSEQDGDQNQEQESDDQSQDGSEQQQPEEQQGKQQQQGSEQQQQKSKQENEQQQSQSQDKSQKQSQQSESEEKQAQSESESQTKQPEGELKPKNAPQTGEQVPSDADFKPGQRMTKEEARKMLQAVRDRDFRRRLDKLRQMQTRRVRVEKDW